MPFTREQKESLMESYRESFANAPNAFLVSAQEFLGTHLPQPALHSPG